MVRSAANILSYLDSYLDFFKFAYMSVGFDSVMDRLDRALST